MFSTICICFSTSISRSAACTCSVTPRRSAASWAPRRMSTKNGWFNVFSTSATVGLLVLVVDGPRLQDTERAAIAIIQKRQPRKHEGTKKSGCISLLGLRTVFPFQDRIEQYRNDDDAADHDLLQ